MARDPIINKASNSSGSPKAAHGGRVTSVKHGGANFSPAGLRPGSPPPKAAGK